MRVERYSDAASFLEAAQPFLLENEAENSVLAAALRIARTGSDDSDGYFAVVRHADEGGHAAIQGAAIRAQPGIVLNTQLRSQEAIAVLANDLSAYHGGVRELAGPEPSCGALARELAARTGRTAERRMHSRVHELTRVELPDPIAPGRLRLAVAADLPLLIDWVAAFCAAIGDPVEQAPEIARARVGAGVLFIWDDGQPLAMAAKARQTPNGISINLVYTPPSLRGRGYASACVGKLTERLLAEGHRFVCLYTDVTNKTSNAIYYRLGYRPVSDAGIYALL